MQSIRLLESLPDSALAALAGTFLDHRHYDRVIRDTAIVLKADGTPLLIYVKDALPRSLCRVAFDVLKDVHFTTNRRTQAAGGQNRVNSGIVGYYERYPTIPYCRAAAWNEAHPAGFTRVRPFFSAISRKYRDLAPTQWEAQKRFVDSVAQDFVIRDTVFTTITVNHNWQTAAHTDPRNIRDGLAAMAVLAGGRYDGCELVFPKYRTAVDVRTGGLCLSDMHELHGNAPLIGSPGRFVRLSIVLYARAKMSECGTAEEELRRAADLLESLPAGEPPRRP